MSLQQHAPVYFRADIAACCGTAGAHSGSAERAAGAARRWLARSAAGATSNMGPPWDHGAAAALDFRGLELTQFPHALTQLTALECLVASKNDFAEVPAAITALSGLTVLRLGRLVPPGDLLQLHETRPLDARALGDLSGFPALRELSFECCEVMLAPCWAPYGTRALPASASRSRTLRPSAGPWCCSWARRSGA